MAVTIAGRQFWLWRAVDDEGEVLSRPARATHGATRLGCGRRAIRGERKGLTAGNLARVEEFEMARLKLRHQERLAIE
jgi:hypothetical protein